jgi:hypothetical protein
VSAEHDTVFMITNVRCFSSCSDLHTTGKALFRTRIFPGHPIIFVDLPALLGDERHPRSGASRMARKGGHVIQVAINEQNLVPYIVCPPIRDNQLLSIAIATRLNLPWCRWI